MAAFASGVGSVVSGLINNGRSLPTVDIQPLLDTINSSGKYQRELINALPDEVKQQLREYTDSMGAGAAKYQSAIEALGQGYKDDVSKLYDPNSPANQAALASTKKEIYSTLPGTQNAIRNALAATGGLSRGNAAASLAQPYVQAAQTYGTKAADFVTDQNQRGQAAQQQALQQVMNMDNTMFQNMFGMTKDQAQQILTTGNQALKDQLSALLTQSNNQTNQLLSANGVAINNGYQNAVTRNAQQAAIVNGLGQLPSQFQDESDTNVDRFMSMFGSGLGGQQGGGGGGGGGGAMPAIAGMLA